MMRSLLISVAIITGAVLTACSDNSSGPDLGGDFGQVSLTVSGDVQGEKSGQADFYGDEPGGQGIHYWELSFNDFSPQTYSLQLSLTDFEEIQRPGTGTYEIGFDPPNPFQERGEPVFFGIYTHIPNGSFSNAMEFETGLFCTEESPRGGTLVITSSSSDAVSGSFSFKAANYDFDDSGNCISQGEIEVAGEFNARARRF
ncbi:MAG: hypothetical protein JJU37_13305 [Balneolaceae bacterium]|nr:hypothetical protein [Balneolaceae bacterium]